MSSRGSLPFAGLFLVLSACQIHARDRTLWQEPEKSAFLTGPYIILGSPGTAFIALRAELEEPPEIDYWVQEGDPAALAAATSTTGGAPRPDGAEVPGPELPAVKTARARRHEDMWMATLRDLPSGPRVAYRIRSALGTTEVRRFRTGISDGESLRFAAFGDTRTGHQVHRAVIERVAEENVDFVLHSGDMVERGGKREQWDRFFQIERPLLDEVPILPAIGNHDYGSRQYFRRYFLHDFWAGDRRYFTHDWGNLRVVAVDAGIECRHGCEQFTFAERALADGADKGMLMLIFLHFPPYSSGAHGSNMDVQEPVTDLARRHGVELVIAGHDHNYERTHPIHGTTFVVSGSAGAPIRAVEPRWFTVEARTEPHYVLFDVEEERIILRAINLAGETFDTAVIDPVPPG